MSTEPANAEEALAQVPMDLLTREQAIELLKLAARNMQLSAENTGKLLAVLEQAQTKCVALEQRVAELEKQLDDTRES